MFKRMCKKQGKSVYNEFMHLISVYQSDIIASEANFVEDRQIDYVQCNFCGMKCKSEMGLTQHEKHCNEKPTP